MEIIIGKPRPVQLSRTLPYSTLLDSKLSDYLTVSNLTLLFSTLLYPI